jgi:MHS family alpha-ketoglutarate permease-like MFS transporter
LLAGLLAGTASLITLGFKSIGKESWFYYYLTGMIATSLLVYVFKRDTKKHSAMQLPHVRQARSQS